MSAHRCQQHHHIQSLALLRCSKAQCDLEIDVREIAGVDGVQVKKLPCRFAALERKADDALLGCARQEGHRSRRVRRAVGTRKIPNFKYVPVLSEPSAWDQWSGRMGIVHRAVIEDLPDLLGRQVYACGAPVMVESAQRDFMQHHRLPGGEFVADAFTTSTPMYL